jgi:hypothetical protein
MEEIKQRQFVEKPQSLNLKDEELEYNEEGDLVPIKYKGNYGRNPNGVNGSLEDPRQQKTWDIYVQMFKEGKPNAKEAALLAGYAPNFAGNIVNTKWFKEKKKRLKKKNMLSKAESNLSRLMRMDWSSIKLVDGVEVEEINIDKAKLVGDISRYITSTLGKDEGYSTKTEEDKNVRHDIKIESVSYADALPMEAKQPVIDVIHEEIKEANE